MIYGMSQEEFWKENPYLARAYSEKNRLEKELKNNDEWWQGVYIREAVLSAMSGSLYWVKKQYNYPNKPYRITQYSEEEKLEIAERERKKAIAQLTMWKDSWDRQNGKRK